MSQEKDITFAMDASSEFCKEVDGKFEYHFVREGGVVRTSEEMVEWYASLVEKYPIKSIEDGLGERRWAGWQLLTAKIRR